MDATQMLIKFGADISICDITGSNPLHTASRFGQTNLCAFLIEKNQKLVIAKDKNGNFPIHFAKNTDIIKLLISNEGRINCKNKDR
jgi:ankyrin repeat protein